MTKSITTIIDELKKYETLVEAFEKNELEIQLVKKVPQKHYAFINFTEHSSHSLTDKVVLDYIGAYCKKQALDLKRELKVALKNV
jgi:hypothetical protein